MTAPLWDPIALTAADLAENPEEQMGTKDKGWVSLPGDDRLWLMKIARKAEFDGVVAGEDWAEWLVHHLAGLIGLPTATVRPATYGGRRASVSRNVLSGDAERLEHGNNLLAGALPSYVQKAKGENPDYSPLNVRKALDEVAPPVEVAANARLSAYDVWAGYLILDAWLAGQDRHDENWAAIIATDHQRLAPSFDHGNALGFLLRDDERQRRLAESQGVRNWAARGRSRHFAGRPALRDLAFEALLLASPEARAHWIDRLDAVDLGYAESLIEQVPGDTMSEVGRSFVLSLLEINRGRLLDGYRSL